MGAGGAKMAKFLSFKFFLLKLTPWWLDIAYLSARTPLPVVTSPGITFPYSVSGRDEVIDLAAKIIQSALLFHHKILTLILFLKYIL